MIGCITYAMEVSSLSAPGLIKRLSLCQISLYEMWSRIAKFTIDVFMKINGQAVFKDLIQNVRLIFSA